MIFFNELYVGAILLASLFFWSIPHERWRTWFIIIASLIGLAFIQLEFALLLMIVVINVFWISKVLQKDRKLSWLVFSMVALGIILLTFKYFREIFILIFSEENQLSQNYIVPLGLSYLTFKLIAFLLDVYRGNITDPNLEDLLTFILFLPIFPAGPIERYQNFAGKRRVVFDAAFYIGGLHRIAIGYFKKVVIVNYLLYEIIYHNFFPQITSKNPSIELSSGLVFLFLVGSLIYAYFDLSAYADIAIGFGQLFGYRICENMHFPILQKNLSDYWNCWHISLSHWCRNNVYFPVLGNTRNNTLALYSSFIVMGLWHNISLNWYLWGIWHATGIAIFSRWNRFKRKRKKWIQCIPPKIRTYFGICLTMTYAGVGFAFIMVDTTHEALRVIVALII